MANIEEKTQKHLKVLKNIIFGVLILVLLWFCLVLSEFFRVQNDQKPMFCFNEIKDVEDDDEYSITCFGVFYKYREYYYKDNEDVSAKEFTLFLREFDRKRSN